MSPQESSKLVKTSGNEEAMLVQHFPSYKVGEGQIVPHKPSPTMGLKEAEKREVFVQCCFSPRTILLFECLEGLG